MSRVALLIGVSQYPVGLPPMAQVETDLAALERALKSSPVNVVVEQCLLNAALVETEAAIEQFFNYRQPEDQAILVMAGYAFLDRKSLLSRRDHIYFATADTAPDRQGQLSKANTIPASFILDAMNGSPAQHQVVILDNCFRQSFSNEAVSDQRPVALTLLMGEGRVILTATSSTHQGTAPATPQLWSYLRYLTEGLETGAADGDGNGSLSAEDLHQYVERKLKVAAPAMDPQILVGEGAAATCPLLTVATETPEARFRKLLEGALERGDVDAANCEIKGRTLLTEIHTYLGLDPTQAHQMEQEVLRPYLEHRQRLQDYEQGMTTHQPQTSASLKQLRQSLWLTERDTAAIDARPYLAERQRQRLEYQAKLSQYEQILLVALQHQYPVEESEQQQLDQLKQVLGLRDEDVRLIEDQLIARMPPPNLGDSPRPLDSFFSPPLATTMEPQPHQPGPPSNFPDQMPSASPPASEAIPTDLHPTVPPNSQLGSIPPQSPQPQSPQPVIQSNEAPPQMELSPNKEAVLQRLVSFNPGMGPPPTALASETTLQPGSDPAGTTPLPPTAASTPSRDAPGGSAPPPETLPSESWKRSRANNLKGLIIPAMILATVGGVVAATIPYWGSQFFSQSINPNQVMTESVEMQTSLRQANSLLQRGQYDEAIAAYNKALQINPNSAEAYIQRGVAYHRKGDLSAARRDNDRAIELLQSAIKGNGGRSTPQINDKMASAYNNRSHVYFDLDNYQQAESDARQAITLKPQLLRAFTNLGNALYKQGRVNEAIQEYTRVIQQQPVDLNLLAGTYTNRGNVYQTLNQMDLALKDYNQALKIDPTYADAYFNRAIMLERQSNLTQAARDFEQAAALYGKQGNVELQRQASEQANRLRQPSVPAPPSTATSPQIL
ncbi:MAG: tetratricopeptide repeat protein [Leptolyngbyaceae cyanobacterium]